MKPKKILSVIMTFIMMLSLLPSLVFAAAEPAGKLDGKLKIKGTAAVGSVLSADYVKVTPEGLTDDYVSFSWSRMVGDQITEVSKEKTYTLVDEDLGNKIELKITGLEELGVTGELKANTVAIVATPEEAPEETTEEKPEEAIEPGEAEEPVTEDEPAEEPGNEEGVLVLGESSEDDGDLQEMGEAPDSADEMQPSDGPEYSVPDEAGTESSEEITVNDEVIEIGTEETLVVPQNAEPLTYSAEAVVESETGSLEFGSLDEGYTEIPEAQYVTIKNNGTGELNFKPIAPDHFMAQDITEPLPAGESVNVWIQPREGVAAGTYADTITYETEEGAEVSFGANLIVNAVAPLEETPEPAPANVQVTDGDLNFGTIKQGQTVEPRMIRLANAGEEAVTILLPVSSYYTISTDGNLELQPGDSIVLNVAPNPTEVGDYTEEIPVKKAESEEVLCTVTAAFAIEEADRPALTANVTGLTFENKEEGYAEAPAAQTVTLTNTGNVALTGITVEAAGQEFSVSGLSADAADVNGTVTFNVAPVLGLKEGTYTQIITVKSAEAEAVTLTATFTVTAVPVKLTAVNKPSDISLPNGVEKSASGLKLPSSITIETNKGSMAAAVTWDVKGCAYNQKTTDVQKFSVKGTVTLPDGVTNPDNLNLITSVNVTVRRGVKLADAANNAITGISSDGAYTTETKITFTAVGAGMDNADPINGDTRYLPLNWSVLEARSWDAAPYSATFRMGKNGSYTLTVTFNQQKFDGSNWVNTGVQDTKQVNFTVAAAAGQTLTPAADKTDANQKKAVQTGDNTPILPFVVILVAAVVLIAGILVYRSKKR